MNSDPRDYKLDIRALCGDNADVEKTVAQPSAQPVARPWLSVMFDCCRVYQRVYRVPDGTGYQGRCPRCGGTIRFVVGHGGTQLRSFRVS